METFIREILKFGIQDDMIDKILDSSLEYFIAAFTTPEYNKEKNYEFFEQLGDLSINKFIVNYMSRKFPQLRSSKGVGVLASLRILYGSKDILSIMSEKYQFDKYLNITQDELLDKSKYRDILEDIFEAFFGALEFSIDKIYYHGLGYICVYTILSRMFDDIEIKIDYENLVDAKTRLNELKDEHKLKINYTEKRLPDGQFFSQVYVNEKLAGEGISNTKKFSQINAAEKALEWIKINLNIVKEIPDRYKNIGSFTW